MMEFHPNSLKPKFTYSNVLEKPVTVKCSDMAAMIQVSRDLHCAIENIKPDFIVLFARGALPLGYSLNIRNNQYVYHVFPGLASDVWQAYNSADFFISEMKKIVTGKSHAKFVIIDTTTVGNALNNALNAIDELARQTSTNLEVYFEYILGHQQNVGKTLHASTWLVDDCTVVRPALLSTHTYAQIKSQQIPLYQNLNIQILYHRIENLFTEDHKDLLGGDILPGVVPNFNAAAGSGKFIFVSDSGHTPSSSIGANNSSHMLINYIAEHGIRRLIDWQNEANYNYIGPVTQEYILGVYSQPSYPDSNYEEYLSTKSGILQDYEIHWLGTYGSTGTCSHRLRHLLSKVHDKETTEYLDAYLSRIFPNNIPSDITPTLRLKSWQKFLSSQK